MIMPTWTGVHHRGIERGGFNMGTFLVALVLIVAGCTVLTSDTGHTCGEGLGENKKSADGIGISGKLELTMALAIVKSPDGSGTAKIEWSPAYSITNLTNSRICVYDVITEFPQKYDKAGRLSVLGAAGGTRQVDIYLNNAAVISQQPSSTERPPFEVEPGATVLVRFYQYLVLTVDGQVVPLNINDDLSELLGPLFGLSRLNGGSYQCAVQYPLRTVVKSDLGTSVQVLTNAIMPDGCVLVIPTD